VERFTCLSKNLEGESQTKNFFATKFSSEAGETQPLDAYKLSKKRDIDEVILYFAHGEGFCRQVLPSYICK
jgi:hypothetical protein